MKDFTFIFMVYNLDPLHAYGPTENFERYNRIMEQLVLMPLKEEKANYVLIDHKTEGTPDKNIKYRNTKIRTVDRGQDGKNSISNEHYNFGVRNIGDSDSLAGIYLLIKEKYPAKKYVLFIYNHSNFTGHLTSRVVLDKLIKILVKINMGSIMGSEETNKDLTDDQKKSFDSDIQEILPDFRNPENYDMLTNAELANAIRVAFVLNPPQIQEGEDRRVDAIFFDSCYTAAIDNLYLYGAACKNIVAAEGIIHYDSLCISKILARFYGGNDTRKVIDETIRNFDNDFKEIVHLKGGDDYRKTLISGFNFLEGFQNDFLTAFNSLLGDMMTDIDFIAKYIIEKSRRSVLWKDCFHIYNNRNPDPKKQETDTYCVDFFSFFEEISIATKGRPYHSKITNLLNLLKGCMGEVYKGDMVDGKSFKGVSLFFTWDIFALNATKKKEIDYSYSFHSIFQNAFARNTYWPEFIQLFQKKTLGNK